MSDIFIRIFNPDINSKTGQLLPPNSPRRGTPEWREFERLILSSLESLGYCHDFSQPDKCIFLQKETPLEEDDISNQNDYKRMYVHKCKRDVPQGDLFYMQMHMRQLFTIDSNGWGADHSGNELFNHTDLPVEETRNFSNHLSDSLLSKGESKLPQPQVTDITPERFILVPTQTPRDYTIKYHSPITVKYFIESIVSWANESENHVCFKLHPCGRDNDLVNAVEVSRYVHLIEGNIHELIKRSNGLFVINSGTGFESLIHGKPVATFGACDYNKVTHNADIRRLDEARNFIYSYKQEWKDLAYKFVWWYWNCHAYDVNSPNTPSRLTEYLRGALK